jgi:serine phosphatase RsbU (regulator of sigma subunit)
VFAAVAEFAGGTPQHDDMTLLVMRVESAPS